MDIVELARDYLVDPKEAMGKLTAGYLNEVMQLEAQQQIQAGPYERTRKRKGHRNGSRPRTLTTIHCDITLDQRCGGEPRSRAGGVCSRRRIKPDQAS